MSARALTVPQPSLDDSDANPPVDVMSMGTRPPITSFAATMMSCTITVRTDKARRELGYAPVITVDAGLAAMQPEP